MCESGPEQWEEERRVCVWNFLNIIANELKRKFS
jgi:hypothetical protein